MGGHHRRACRAEPLAELDTSLDVLDALPAAHRRGARVGFAVLGSVRPGGGRSARRPPSHHALDVRWTCSGPGSCSWSSIRPSCTSAVTVSSRPRAPRRHRPRTASFRRQHPAMTGDDAACAVDQHRVVQPNSRMLAAICATWASGVGVDCAHRGSARPAAARRSADRPCSEPHKRPRIDGLLRAGIQGFSHLAPRIPPPGISRAHTARGAPGPRRPIS